MRWRARCSSRGGGYFPALRIQKVPSLLLTLVYPPNVLLAPDFWCSRAALTPAEAARVLPVEYEPDLREPP